ncbi:pupal cuticle protein 27-like [Pieris napi]|uniref:pupal cuticle protein 27-like n=1 Tax=Pieris napi TaxID=78633 RepID=UPI001FB93BB9|nr:pupal cuticle protein 27-like [Pieris napi]
MYFRLIALLVSFVCLCDGSVENKVPVDEIVHPAFFELPETHVQKRDSPVETRLKENKNEIPVTVVYEVTAKPEKPKRRKLIRQGRNNVTQTTQSTIKSTTPLPKITTVSTDKGVTLFPKRPEEDSKRIEFQRRSRMRPPVVKILDETNFVYAHSGNFHYSYDTADGTKISSEGKLLKNDKNEGMGEAVIGSVSYTDDEGKDFSLSYTADENGYRPVGAHLPTPPPIPPEIARALEILATKKPDIGTDYY